MKRFLPKLFFFFLLLSLSPTATLAQTEFWSTPQKINTTSTYAISPATVTDQQGYFHSVWMEMDTNDQSGWANNPGIFYSYWNGDVWSAPEVVSLSDYSAFYPVIAADNSNNIYAVWQDSGGFGGLTYQGLSSAPANTTNSFFRIIMRRKTQAGWEAPRVVSAGVDGDNTQASWPAVAVDAGTIHVVFSFDADLSSDPAWQVYYTKSTDQGVSWSPPVVIGNDSEDDIPSLVVDNSGNLHLAYHTRSGTTLGVKYRRLASGADGRFAVNWDPIVPLGDTGIQTYSEYPRLAVDGSGNLFIAWDEPTQQGAIGNTTVKVTRRSSSGIWWGAPFPVSTSGAYSGWGFSITGVTTDSSGNAYVGWGQKEDNGTITARYRRWTAAGDSWSSDSIIRTTNDMDAPFIYKDKWDNQHFIWTEQNAGLDWETWYSVVPAAVGSYNPARDFTLTHPVTNDTLTIPANALASAATISAQIGPLPASFNNTFTTIRRSYTYRPHGTTFIGGKTATAVVHYQDSEVVGADERNMKVYFWDSTLPTPGWATLSGSVSTGQNKFTVSTLAHFSWYGVTLPTVNLTFTLPEASFEGAEMPVNFDMSYADGSGAVPPVVSGLEDAQPGANVALLLKDESGSVVRSYYSDAVEGNQFAVNGSNYSVNIPVLFLPEGNYTLAVEIGGTDIKSISFHFVPPIISAEFLPPLSNNEEYIMPDGSTLPIKFKLKVEGEVLFENVEMMVKVPEITTPFTIGEGSSNIRFDPLTGQYILNLHTKDYNLVTGTHTVKVYVNGNEVGSTTFQLLEGGKAKGRN